MWKPSLFAQLGLFAALACGCSSDGESGTTGKTITLKTRAEITDDLSEGQPNALGWQVKLSKAYLSVGALYYYSGDPVLSRRPASRSASALAYLSDLLVPAAHAHPGHYIAGAAMGQMLVPQTLDLLAGSVELADGQGITGLTNSARFIWQSPPQGELAPRLLGNVVLTEGEATKGDSVIHFVANADEPEVHDGDDKAEVAGCAFGAAPGQVGVELDGDGTVTLTLVPRVWFEQVACSGTDEGHGTVTFTTWGEEFIEEGLVSDVFPRDHYSVKYSKFLVVYRNLTIADDHGEVAAELPHPLVFDMTKKAVGKAKTLAIFALEAKAWPDVSYQVGPITDDAEPGDLASTDDVALLQADGASVHVEGTAISPQGDKKTFNWSFSPATLFQGCHGGRGGPRAR